MALDELPNESKSTSVAETTLEDSKKGDLQTSNTTLEKESNMAEQIHDETVADAKETNPADVEDESAMEYPHGLKLVVILGALCLAVFLVALDQTIIATAIPKITDKFNSIKDIGWYGSAYLVTATALQPTFGRIYTIFSIKYTFLTAILIFELGSLVCATAPSSVALIVGRAIAGMGTGGLFSGSINIMAYCLPLRKRPAAFGLIGGMWGIASVAGPLLGGVFTWVVLSTGLEHLLISSVIEYHGDGAFTSSESSLPIGALAVTVIAFFLHIHRENNPDNLTVGQRILKLDLVGASILVPAVVCLLLALQWGGSTYPWSSSRIIGLFVGFGILITLFIISQLYLGDAGTLPPRLFKKRNVVLAFTFAFLFGAGFFALIFYLAIYFQSVKGSSATEAGIQLLPLLISTVLSSITTGGLITVIGYYVPVQLFCMALFSIGAGLITTFDLTTPLSHWFGYQVICGLGIGVGFQSGVIVVQTVLPLSDVPVATACVSFFQTLGGALLISVAQTLFQNGLLSGIEKNAPQLPAQLFLHSGATQIRQILAEINQEEALDVVLQAYVDGLTHCYWITTACAIAAFFIVCGLEWRSVKKGHGQEKEKSKDAEKGVNTETDGGNVVAEDKETA
ncbi:hypothetical protein G7Y89_g133 [Cudoniella acicularis]|uniref:Major facilitator superfamily (MFS) profile domain-containing protein n=1 Tax=Cudoniella acicularis TaxID=354080 RepID=A0A8H4W8K9_9HELO|nr:hypothetical protein G7Y89_g133 [Cudoniella acicularis]